MQQILIALAGLMGAAGVILTAAGAHSRPGVGLEAAGYLLLIHAVAVIAGCAALRFGLIQRPLGSTALGGFILGGALFATDVTIHAYLKSHLFPFAAPTGGMIMILSWLVVIGAALTAARGS